MNLPGLSVRRPVTVLMLTFMILILGSVSLSRLPIDLLPNMEIPVAVVVTNYPGVGPQEIEKIITKPVEESIATVQNIDIMSSTSSEGSSLVIAQFNYGTDMNFATLEMREKIDLIKRFLPEDAENPMVLKFDPSSMPIMQMSLSSETDDLGKLQTFADETIKPRLERVEGVASVNIEGGYEDIVEVKLNREKMSGYGLSIDYVSQILGAENLNLPGGKVKKGDQDLTIRTTGEFQSLDDIRRMLVPLPTGGSVYLNDIAEVALTYADMNTIAKTDGKASIILSLQKQSGTNTVQVSEAALREIAKIREENPQVKLDMIMDTADYIKQSINEVYKNGAVGALLAVLVLFMFLRNFRTTFIIGASIPISVIATFILIYFSGITINLMTLGGLALGVGMLVDNAIVALENIFRFRQEGYSRVESAIKGASEVGMALTASTLTTVAVFLPIVFVEGITATLFKELALVVTFSLLASLVVSLSLIPMLSSKFLKIDRNGSQHRRGLFGLFDRFYDGFDRGFARVMNSYKRALGWALRRRKTTIGIAALIFFLSIASVFTVGAEFFPAMDQGFVQIDVSLPNGSELTQTEEILNRIEGTMEQIPEVENVFTVIGNSGDNMGIGGARTNRGTVYVKLTAMKTRIRTDKQVSDEIRGYVKDIAGAKINVQPMQALSFGSGSPISININGDDLETLKKIGDDFVEIVESVEGTREVKSSLADGVPEVQITIDRKNASQYGLTAAQIAQAVRGTISGTTATRYKYEGKEINVVLKGDESYQESILNLEQVPISTPNGGRVPLGQVAAVNIERGPVSINRESQVRVITVSSQIIDRDLRSIATDIEQKLTNYDMPPGYDYKLGGENEELNDAFGDLALALILAVVLVFMILASQFESIFHPLAIMLSVPLGFSGGLLGLSIARKTLSVPGFIGMIMLAGIVVNNAIVLVDYINTRRRNGESREEAIVNAGPIRLRPILMTTLTTVLGLIPLALGIGEGSEAQAPMAVVVIGGLTLSTLLTLVFIPVVYTILDDLSIWLKNKTTKNKHKGSTVNTVNVTHQA